VDGAHQVGVEGFVALAEHERPQRTQIELSRESAGMSDAITLPGQL
jgi:hypothetical protein